MLSDAPVISMVDPARHFRQEIIQQQSPQTMPRLVSRQLSADTSPRSDQIKNQMFVKFHRYLKKTGASAVARRKLKAKRRFKREFSKEVMTKVNLTYMGEDLGFTVNELRKSGSNSNQGGDNGGNEEKESGLVGKRNFEEFEKEGEEKGDKVKIGGEGGKFVLSFPKGLLGRVKQ